MTRTQHSPLPHVNIHDVLCLSWPYGDFAITDVVTDPLPDQEIWCTPSKRARGRCIDELAQWVGQHHEGEPFVNFDDTDSGASRPPAVTNSTHRFLRRVVLCVVNFGLPAAHVELALTNSRLPVVASAEFNRSTDGAGQVQ